METLVGHSLAMPTTTITTSSLQDRIKAYYNDAGPDYEYWSPAFNMHFGYGTVIDFFQREKMLEAMNRKVLQALQLDTTKENAVLDMGCGLSATLRHAARLYPHTKLTGITLVPWQISKGNELNRLAGQAHAINLVEGDYTNMPFADNSFDGVYAIESACHCPGDNKEAFVREMSRVLKKGGCFSLTDGFTKNPQLPFNPFTKMCYHSICNNWALPSMAEIEAFKSCLVKYGFTDIVVEDLSWKVAPSVLHAPYVIVSFLLKKLLANEKLQAQRIRNLKGSFLSLIVGLCRLKFGYYHITGTKQ